MDLQKARKEMQKVQKYFRDEISKIRGNRANPGLIEDIRVDVYNSRMPINQLGAVNAAEPTLITVQCWDKNNVDKIKKAISESDLNITPSSEGDLIRVPLPPLTRDRREELVKVIKKLLEDAKVSIRRIRRDFIDSLENDGISEDELERGKKGVQELVDKFNKEFESDFENKKKELISI